MTTRHFLALPAAGRLVLASALFLLLPACAARSRLE